MGTWSAEWERQVWTGFSSGREECAHITDENVVPKSMPITKRGVGVADAGAGDVWAPMMTVVVDYKLDEDFAVAEKSR